MNCCVSVIQGSADGRLELQFSRDNDEVEVSCQYNGVLARVPAPSDESLDGLSERILDALVDDHGHNEEDGQRRGHGYASGGPSDPADGVAGRFVRGNVRDIRRVRQNHDDRLRDELVEAHLGLAHQFARRFTNRGESYEGTLSR